MKKRILSVALLVSAWGGYSQVGIGTLTPDKSSQLDVTANNKGILIPRVNLTSTTDTTTITNGNVNSLLVFNTATQNDITPGYYYWYIDKWKRMVNDDEVGGNVYYDGDTFTYVDANGETQIVNVKKLVQDNESQTVIITVDDQQYYISEAYLSENDGVVPTTVDPTAIPDGIYLIDVIGGVTNNFEEIYNNIVNEEITVNGDTYNSFEEYITHVTESTGGFTKIVYDQTTGDAIFQEWDEVTNTWVNVDNSKIETIVKENETVTTLIDNLDGTYTYTSEDNTITIIDIPASVVENFETIVNDGPVTVNGDTFNTIEEYIEYIANSSVTIQEGDMITVTGTGTAADPYIVSIEEGAVNSMLITNDLGVLEWATIESIVQANETVTTLIDNLDGTYTYTSEDNTITIIDIPASVVENFETIVNDGPVTVNGDTFNTIEEYIEYIANSSVTIQEGDMITVTGTGTAADPYIVDRKSVV